MNDARYIFTMPADTPPLTYALLQGVRKIGTTVTILHGKVEDKTHSGTVPGVTFRLYETDLAHIYPGRVEFTVHGDRHKATDAWLGKIIADNGVGDGCYREQFVLRIGGGWNDGAAVEGASFDAETSCGYCGAVLIRIKAGWLAPKPFYTYGTFSVYAPGSGGRLATVSDQMTCAKSPHKDRAHEPWCNHDAAAVRGGVCECGTRVSR